MAIRSLTSDGYQQVELTSELLHSQSGATQQVISTVPCTKHLPFFFAILLADIFMFGAVLLFAIYANQFAGGFAFERSPELPQRQLNLHALIMLTALVYLNGQAITVYKANYLVKHKSLNMLYHFVLQLLISAALAAGLFMSYEAQEAAHQVGKLAQASEQVSHFYSAHSWVGLIAAALFTAQFIFGVGGFLVTLCCRKMTARLRSRAQPIRKMISMLVLCISVAAVVSGLTQLARFELDGQDGHENYRQLGVGAILINTSAISVVAATILIFVITFTFKRRQAHDLPVLFKSILLVTQFVELILMLVVAEFILQLVTPHINRAINSNFIGNTSLSHIFGNATDSINNLISTARRQLSSPTLPNTDLNQVNQTNPTAILTPPSLTSSPSPTIQLGSANFGSSNASST